MGVCDSNRQHSDDINKGVSCIYNGNELSNKLNDFLERSNLQTSTSDSKNQLYDSVNNEIKERENKKLKNVYDSIKNQFLQDISNYLNYQNLNHLQQLSSQILRNENANKIYNQHIIKEISMINENKKLFKINYLTILLVGKSGVGKSTLINSLLKLKGNKKAKTKTGPFVTIKTQAYKSVEKPFLRLVDTRGIELNVNWSPKNVKEECIKFIRNQLSTNDINNFVHCIWYCITQNRFEECEIELLNSLKGSIANNKIPIIIVYTQATNEDAIKEMQQYIKENQIEADFVKVLALEIPLPNKQSIKPFGLDQLVETTLNNCRKALNGDLRSVMINNIAQSIKKDLTLKVSKISQYINEKTILDCIKEEKVKSSDEFQNYIINIYGNNVKYFLEHEMDKKSGVLIKQSEFIKNHNIFFDYVYRRSNEIISNRLSGLAFYFLDIQATVEKEKGKAVNNENKRNHLDFMNTSQKFLIDNLNYLAQKYYINFILRNLCPQLTQSFELNLINIIDNLLRDKNIINIINNCFFNKFNDFEERIKNIEPNLNININSNNYNNNRINNTDDFSYNSEQNEKTCNNNNNYRNEKKDFNDLETITTVIL